MKYVAGWKIIASKMKNQSSLYLLFQNLLIPLESYTLLFPNKTCQSFANIMMEKGEINNKYVSKDYAIG